MGIGPSGVISAVREYSTVNGIIIVGANVCKELKKYKRNNFSPIVLFEPIPDIAESLKKHDVIVYNYAISNYVGKSKFNVASNSVSSSLMELKDVKELQNVKTNNVIEVQVTTLDECIDNNEINTLVIDAEGSELNILTGGNKLLETIDIICVEVNYKENYKGCPRSDEVESFLNNKEFKRIRSKFGDSTRSYGDDLYVKNSLL